MTSELVVLVTGCSSGFGVLIAKTLAKAGHTVFATMRGVDARNVTPAAELEAWANEESVALFVSEIDVANTESVNEGVQRIIDRSGRIDVVVNNAGVAGGGPIEAFDIAQMQALFDVNVFGPMRVDKAVLPQMRRRNSGLLIHISSTLGRLLPRSGGLYPASKWAVEGLAESLRYQVAPFGIDVVILEPGSFPTPATVKGLVPGNKAVLDDYQSATPPRPRPAEPAPDYQPPDPQEVADAVLAIIDMEPGTRPLRHVVRPVFTDGVDDFNRLYEHARDALVESLKRPDQAITWGRPR